jgi:pimeloyl-ACP methyl ester carboxylesterase
MAGVGSRLSQSRMAIAGAALLMAVLAWPGLTANVETDPFEQPGHLARLRDGRRLDFRCYGHGAPTVLLESGFGAGANAWGLVSARIAPVTRVCSYDRAGYGFSDPGPLPRDGAAIARDLDQGLKAAGISGPYVLVGHSAGGMYARLFAARRRSQIAGLVFVDSSVPHQTQRLAQQFGSGAGSIDGVRRRPARCLEATSATNAPAKAIDLLECAPLTLGRHARMVAMRPDTYRGQLSELDTLFASTSDEVDRTRGLLRDIPAKADGPAGEAQDPAGQAWQGFHTQLAASFIKGQHRLVKSSHLMMFDRPEVVADAAIELVRDAGNRR